MIKSIHLTALIYGAFVIAAVMLVLEGAQVTTGLFKPCGVIITVLGFALLLFDKWAWSIRAIHPWFVDRPYIQGTWKGVLKSTYIDQQTEEATPPIEAYLVIRQSFSTIYLRLITRESGSETMVCNITKCEDGLYTVASVYRNTPRISVRKRSPIHRGAMLLRVQGDPVKALNGEYWTDRLTKGEIELKECIKTCHYDFESASNAEYPFSS